MCHDNEEIDKVLSGEICQDKYGIWVDQGMEISSLQNIEYNFRKEVSSKEYVNYLDDISKYYSVDVMDSQIDLVLDSLPINSWVLDIGGGWGWHWRYIANRRPDVSVIMMDFVKENLLHAKNVLGDNVGDRIHLLQASATKIPIHKSKIDLVWSVQCFQHIPNIVDALREVERLLCFGGEFRMYDFNYRVIEKYMYMLMKKKYQREEQKDNFFIRRSDDLLENTVSKIFGSPARSEYTEILFQPNFKLRYRYGSFFGKVDALISGSGLFKSLARQRTIIANKV